MEKIIKKSKLNKAIEFLRQKIDKKVWNDGDRLPTYRQLAQQADVGAITMWNAIAVLKKEKKISFKERTGIYVGDEIPKKGLSLGPKMERWTIVAEQLKKDILTGVFEDNEFLPLLKELCEKYGVHFVTLKKALHLLIKEKLLLWYKRRYRILDKKSATRSANGLCLVLSRSVFELELRRPTREIVGEFIQNLENECAKRNKNLIKSCYEDGLDNNAQDTSIQGYIVWVCIQLQVNIRIIIDEIKKYNKPIIIVNLVQDTGTSINNQFAMPKKTMPPIFVCDGTADYRAGFSMGNFLIAKGYTKGCFFLHYNGQPGTSDRFSGLQKAFEESQHKTTLERMVVEEVLDKEKTTLLEKSDVLFDKSREKENIILDVLIKNAKTHFRSPYSLRLDLTANQFRGFCDCRSVYAPVFRKALAIKDAAVWICANDHAAIFGAFEFLRAQGLRVPQDIGLVGFDDFYESKISNLTTWHFDYAGVARKAINLALYPEYAGRLLCNSGTNVFEVDGFVIDRGSV